MSESPVGSVMVPIDAVHEHPRNYREHDVGSLAESLVRFGQPRPIVVQASTMFVIAGNGILKAARALGWTEVEAKIVDFDDQYAIGYMVADNWQATRGRNVDTELLDLMVELREEADLFRAAGLEDDDVEALEREVADMDRPLKLDSRQMMKKPKLLKITCPECGHKFEHETGKGPK